MANYIENIDRLIPLPDGTESLYNEIILYINSKMTSKGCGDGRFKSSIRRIGMLRKLGDNVKLLCGNDLCKDNGGIYCKCKAVDEWLKDNMGL